MPPSFDVPTSAQLPIHRNRDLPAVLVGIIGFFIIGGLVLGASAGGPEAVASIRAFTFVIVLFAPVVALLAIFGVAGTAGALRCVVRAPMLGRSAEEAVTFFQLAAAFSMGFGFLGTLVGMVAMLAHVGAPAEMGPRLAMAFWGQLCGVFLAAACMTTAAHVARRHQATQALAPLARRAVGAAGAVIVAGSMTTLVAFGIILLSRSPGL